VQLVARFVALLLIATVAVRANGSLQHARQAQALLGPELWSRVIRIENDARVSRYPRVVFALVFELAGILWFYTDVDGTQSFSLHHDRLEEEKADFGPLLRDIERGFKRWSFVAENRAPAAPAKRDDLPNGCFIASIAALRALDAAGATIRQPRLLSFYTTGADGPQGHTVLTYARPDGVVVIDPSEEGGPQLFSAALGADALDLARALEGARVAKARWVPVELPGVSRGTARLAGGAAASENAAALRSLGFAQ
jgi:hypothetical protein